MASPEQFRQRLVALKVEQSLKEGLKTVARGREAKALQNSLQQQPQQERAFNKLDAVKIADAAYQQSQAGERIHLKATMKDGKVVIENLNEENNPHP